MHSTLVDQTVGSLSKVLITASDNLRSSTVRMHALVANRISGAVENFDWSSIVCQLFPGQGP
jgi:hypothetical protein